MAPTLRPRHSIYIPKTVLLSKLKRSGYGYVGVDRSEDKKNYYEAPITARLIWFARRFPGQVLPILILDTGLLEQTIAITAAFKECGLSPPQITVCEIKPHTHAHQRKLAGDMPHVSCIHADVMEAVDLEDFDALIIDLMKAVPLHEKYRDWIAKIVRWASHENARNRRYLAYTTACRTGIPMTVAEGDSELLCRFSPRKRTVRERRKGIARCGAYLVFGHMATWQQKAKSRPMHVHHFGPARMFRTALTKGPKYDVEENGTVLGYPGVTMEI